MLGRRQVMSAVVLNRKLVVRAPKVHPQRESLLVDQHEIGLEARQSGVAKEQAQPRLRRRIDAHPHQCEGLPEQWKTGRAALACCVFPELRQGKLRSFRVRPAEVLTHQTVGYDHEVLKGQVAGSGQVQQGAGLARNWYARTAHDVGRNVAR